MAFDRAIGGMTVECEAGGEPFDGKVGVAASFFNRLKTGRYGKTIAQICLARYQYSEWNDDRQDNANLERVAGMHEDDLIISLRAYDAAASGQDPTNGATHYLRYDVNPKPAWVAQGTFTVRIGNHEFYKDVP